MLSKQREGRRIGRYTGKAIDGLQLPGEKSADILKLHSLCGTTEDAGQVSLPVSLMV